MFLSMTDCSPFHTLQEEREHMGGSASSQITD
jgi:hypothetical protein